MDKETIDEMIRKQVVYEITYKKDVDAKKLHISCVMYSQEYGDNYICAYCYEASKKLVFSIRKIVSVKEYWVGIMSKDVAVPADGLYLIAYVRPGGVLFAIDYELHELKEGCLFDGRDNSIAKPIAYHYIPSFDMYNEEWIDKYVVLRKWENEIIPAPVKGIPIIAYKEPRGKKESNVNNAINYWIGNDWRGKELLHYMRNGISMVYEGVKKNDDISICFKEYDNSGPFGWSDCWEGYEIIGFAMVCEYDVYTGMQHVKYRLNMEPDFLWGNDMIFVWS